MILKNASVLDSDFVFRNTDVQVLNGKIAGTGTFPNSISDECLDLSGMLLIPGLVETHFHGALGLDSRMAKREVFETFARYEASEGVTSFVPGLAASPDDCILRFLRSGVDYMVNPAGGSKMQGLYLEGPFISPIYRGGQQPDALQLPSLEKLQLWNEVSDGRLCKITIAPELKNSGSVISWAARQGMAVEMGHTGATYDEAIAAIESGASLLTHTFNAMVPLYHRQPGVLGAALTDDRVTCELIADFGHVAPPAVKLVCLAKGRDKVNIISDSCVAAGIGDGNYQTADGRPLCVRNGIARMPNGTITGSACSIMTGVRNLVKLGIPLEDAVKMASFNPAKTIGRENEIGSVKTGKYADLVWLDSGLNIRGVMINGIIQAAGAALSN